MGAKQKSIKIPSWIAGELAAERLYKSAPQLIMAIAVHEAAQIPARFDSLKSVTGLSRTTVSATLDYSIGRGWLNTIAIGANSRRCEYKITRIVRSVDECPKVHSVDETRHLKMSEIVHSVDETRDIPASADEISSGTPDATRAGEKGTLSKNLIKPLYLAGFSPEELNQAKPPGRPKKGTYTPEFEQAWALYPRGEQKAKAFDAFERHIKPADREGFLAAIRNIRRAREAKYCPYFCRFVTNEWRDWLTGDPSKKNGTSGGGPKPAGSDRYVPNF